MDGGVREKKVLTETQKIIKENLKKKRSYFPITQHSVTVTAPEAAPLLTTDDQKYAAENPTIPITPPPNNNGIGPSDTPIISYGSIVSAYDDLLSHPYSPPGADGLSEVPQYIYETKPEESNTALLMTFMDRVFPLQYSWLV